MLTRLIFRPLDGFDPLGEFVPTAVKVVEVDSGRGSWQFVAPLKGPQSAAALLETATYPGLEVWDPETGWRFAGYANSIRRVDVDGTDSIAASGLAFQALLDTRRMYPDPADVTNFWSQRSLTGLASTNAIAEVISQAGGTAILERQLFGLQLGTDPLTGPTIDYVADGGDTLLQAFSSWFSGTDHLFRLRLDRSTVDLTSNLLFEVLERPVAEIGIAPELGNVEEKIVETKAATVTHVIGVGEEIGGGPNREVIESGEAETDWTNRRVEAVVNRPGSDAQQTFDEATRYRRARQSSVSVQLRGVRVDRYGADLDLGWYVQVALGESFNAVTELLPVTRSTVQSLPSGGYERVVDVGAAVLDGVDRTYDTVGRLLSRLERVEAQQ